jgi:type IV pilus assembly protein PilV
MAPRTLRGFTLVEVMVSLIVISVGLLGVVGMEGMALSSSQNARMRSLAALEAAGMAAAMHTNRDFWANVPAAVTIQGKSGCATLASAASCIDTDSTGKLAQAGADCTKSGDAPCNINELAAYDTQSWIASLSALLPNPAATINCDNTTIPLTCLITIVWVESAVGLSAQQREAEATAAATVAGGGKAPGFENNSYTLFVQP